MVNTKRNGKMRRSNIYISRINQIALHLAMTVMSFFTPCPRKKCQASYPFGIFPFGMSSSVPETSGILLMKNATSIYVSIYNE